MLNVPITIDSLTLDNRVLLAPLAGVSDAPFRRICRSMGAGLVYVEMLSAAAIIHKSKRTIHLMDRHPSEDVLGVQVTGSSAEEIAAAIVMLDKRDFDTIDINMGCPVKKIVSKGWGSAMLLDPERISRTVMLARNATAKPLSVKIRLGYSRELLNVDEVAARVMDEGADMLTVHGRTRGENYSTPSDWPAIHNAVIRVGECSGGRGVTVGNGDALNPTSARAMMRATGCDAVMVARGALGNPWVLRDMLNGTETALSPSEWLETVVCHMEMHDRHYGGGTRAATLFRKQLLWYIQGFPNSRLLRTHLSVADDLRVVRRQLIGFAKNLPQDVHRAAAYGQHLGMSDDKPAATRLMGNRTSVHDTPTLTPV